MLSIEYMSVIVQSAHIVWVTQLDNNDHSCINSLGQLLVTC